MICVGIDVAKDKHDCFILNSEGEALADVFTILNNADGFDTLLQTIRSYTRPEDKIKVGLEATGHYSYNILGFLLDCGLPTYVINPLHTNLYRKSLSLRKTKTDRIDARTIATMLMSDVDLKSYTDTVYHNEELKSLTRYRFDKVRERAQLKSSIARLVCILFPELEKLVPTLHMASVYTLLSEFPGAKQVASAHLTRLTNLLHEASKGRYGREKAIQIRDAARISIGSAMPASHRPPTSRGSLPAATPTWRNEAPGICAMPFSMPRNSFVTGIQLLRPTLQKNGMRESITMSLSPMLPRSLCD